ncbi:RDD family protein [Legionella birminghamensis]|uniref:RDD family n=1 Tax=Legionella birminghamensis TaxID=28083 RepID=A0A378I6Y6_9GAMM|nr:RDD family protein [Legionella birminghamensis]KTC70191.1 RDD family protein [Legionella birminghamensis]STX30401.1 RDD family [Legionella birminghamensis]
MWIRCIAALLYDCLVLAALAFILTGIAVFLNHGQAISPGNHYLQAALLLLIVSYYFVSLRFGGQTIGMRSWKLGL